MSGPIANSELLIDPGAAYEPSARAEREPERGEFVSPAGGHGESTESTRLDEEGYNIQMANHEILRRQLQDVVVSPPQRPQERAKGGYETL
jgi:hypothetical protein